MNTNEIQKWFLAEIARVANRIRGRLDERKEERHADWMRFALLPDSDQALVRESQDGQDAHLRQALEWEARKPRLTAFLGTTVSLDIHRPFSIEGTTGPDTELAGFETAADLVDATAYDLLNVLNGDGRRAYTSGNREQAKELWRRAEGIRALQRETRFQMWANSHPTCTLN